jgi:hypothetical protein
MGGHNKNKMGGSKNHLKLPSMKCPEELGTGYKCGWEINKALAGEKKKGRKWPHVIFDCQAKTHIAKRVSVCIRMSCTIDDKDATHRVCSPPKKPSNSFTLSLSSKCSSLVAQLMCLMHDFIYLFLATEGPTTTIAPGASPDSEPPPPLNEAEAESPDAPVADGPIPDDDVIDETGEVPPPTEDPTAPMETTADPTANANGDAPTDPTTVAADSVTTAAPA